MFLTPDSASQLKERKVADNPKPQARLISSRLAYLLLPGFTTSDEAERHLYASNLQTLIRGTDARNPCGWVLDLRENTGGNIWPMLAGLGPLIGDGIIGGFVYPGGRKTAVVL